MKALTNHIESQNINSNSSEKINILYLGDIEEVHSNLKNLDEINTQVINYKNSIVAYNDIKKNRIKYDVIICDANMTGINAIEFFQITKKLENNNLIYIITTQHELSNFYIERAKNLKIDDIIEYPFRKSQLSIRIKYLLRKKLSIQENSLSQKKQTNHFKRAFDIIFSSITLIMLSPLFLLVAIAIKIDSNGPVFFTSQRVGTGYKIFPFFKFRSMSSGAENMIDSLKSKNQYNVKENKNDGNQICTECETLGHSCSEILFIDGKNICENSYYKSKKNSNSSFMKFVNDPRVTKLGQFLRKSSIDELPQLVNIFKGDMSFVGNRPLPLYEAEQLTSDEWSERFNAPAGLTGLWQVNKRGKSGMSEEERKQLDNTYARTHTFFGDMSLILRTVPALTQKENV
jgi:lipopolysaccharide/colanic/teichoic acid biosynthesis glycosyltransferase